MRLDIKDKCNYLLYVCIMVMKDLTLVIPSKVTLLGFCVKVNIPCYFLSSELFDLARFF